MGIVGKFRVGDILGLGNENEYPVKWNTAII